MGAIRYWAIIAFFSSTVGWSQIDPCLSQQAFTVVVLGSSTAAGSGPSTADSAWVNRYRAYAQSLNPANQVINLAQGGYTTYHSMPTNFVPPPGRPLPDTAKNVDKALSFNPDAIIINYPSNDASNGFGVAEQMGNFDSMVVHANLQGVPVWVCTTQPKTAFGPAGDAIQIGVRDSIHAHYLTHAIDFWSTIAAPTNDIDTLYDSGDGTHLNDAGHAILFQRVVAAGILEELYAPPGYPDYFVHDLIFPNNITCGSTNEICQVVIGNSGMPGTQNTNLNLMVSNGIPAMQSQVVVGGLPQCTFDTIPFSIDLSAGGMIQFTAWMAEPSDSNQTNDTLVVTHQVLPKPALLSVDDTVCPGDTGYVQAILVNADSTYWYDGWPGNLIGFGSTLPVAGVFDDTTVYAQSVVGPFDNWDSLHTTTTSTTNWNGIMFDVVATNDSIIIDSLSTKVNTIGQQIIEIYRKPGSHFGHETNAGAWTLWGIDTVTVPAIGAIINLDPGVFTLPAGDTMGVYIQMQNPAADVSYQAVGNQQSISNGEVELICGSGANHNFGGNYYPRVWNGTLHYHHGYNPQGTCQSDPVAVQVVLSDTTFVLGSDTTIYLGDTIEFSALGYFGHQWSTGDTAASIDLIAGVDLGVGTHTISLQVYNAQGCAMSDSLLVTVEDPTGVTDLSGNSTLEIYPNPARDITSVKTSYSGGELRIMTVAGQLLARHQMIQEECQLDVSAMPPGTYLLIWSDDEHQAFGRLVVR